MNFINKKLREVESILFGGEFNIYSNKYSIFEMGNLFLEFLRTKNNLISFEFENFILNRKMVETLNKIVFNNKETLENLSLSNCVFGRNMTGFTSHLKKHNIHSFIFDDNERGCCNQFTVIPYVVPLDCKGKIISQNPNTMPFNLLIQLNKKDSVSLPSKENIIQLPNKEDRTQLSNQEDRI